MTEASQRAHEPTIRRTDKPAPQTISPQIVSLCIKRARHVHGNQSSSKNPYETGSVEDLAIQRPVAGHKLSGRYWHARCQRRTNEGNIEDSETRERCNPRKTKSPRYLSGNTNIHRSHQRGSVGELPARRPFVINGGRLWYPRADSKDQQLAERSKVTLEAKDERWTTSNKARRAGHERMIPLDHGRQ
jgi:hypothetical protein